ncbi:hypothetical protein A0H81_03496 [Grifola frondosa]|uniref:DUF6534 domain-containing protein n=1 Tax=Grifola frondosa TaxID=5627 RepID=A0A1C7MJB8_GRIFR|nr:hypothetical protein A0H81_03496 [Grifola frondosa]
MTVVDNLLGSILLGVLIACVLYGATTLQTFMYMQTYPKDPRFLKIMVAILWGIETLHTGFCMQFIYEYTITNFGNLEFMSTIYWAGSLTVLLGILIQLIVHSFYIRRVWILTNGSLLFTAPLVLLAGCRFGFGIATTAYSYVIVSWANFRLNKGPLVTLSVGIGCSACIDVAVAAILIYHLRKGRNGWKSSDGMLTWLSVYTINTGALTSIFSVITVLLFATEKNSIIFMAFVEMQSKLYANSFLGSLNARQHIRNKYNDQSSFALSARSQFKAATPARVDIFQDTIITEDTGTAATQPMAFADKKRDELV